MMTAMFKIGMNGGTRCLWRCSNRSSKALLNHSYLPHLQQQKQQEQQQQQQQQQVRNYNCYDDDCQHPPPPTLYRRCCASSVLTTTTTTTTATGSKSSVTASSPIISIDGRIARLQYHLSHHHQPFHFPFYSLSTIRRNSSISSSISSSFRTIHHSSSDSSSSSSTTITTKETSAEASGVGSNSSSSAKFQEQQQQVPPPPPQQQQQQAPPPPQQQQPPPPPKQQPYQYMTRDGIPLKLPDPQVETKFLEQQHTVRSEYSKGNYTKALELSQTLHGHMLKHYGTMYHPGVASTLNNMGLMHKSLGEWDLARDNYQQAMSIYDKVVGTDHASYAATLHNVALLNKLQVQMEQRQERERQQQQQQQQQQKGIADAETIIGEGMTQIPTSTNTKHHQQLMDEAVSFMERAWRIREVELGVDHPKTIESRSSLGSTLAYQILFHHSQMQQMELQEQQQQQEQDNDDDEETTKASSSSSSSPKTKRANSAGSTDAEKQVYGNAVKIRKLTVRQWQVAEEHLREAFKAAVANAARAEEQAAAATKTKTKTTTSGGGGGGGGCCGGGGKGKEEQQQQQEEATKENKEEKPPVIVVTTSSSNSNSNNTNTAKSTTKSTSSKSTNASNNNNNNDDKSQHRLVVANLAVATAAQNLAVCLKYRAMSNTVAVPSQTSLPTNFEKKQKFLLEQAKELYQRALSTRLALLGGGGGADGGDEFHPQIVMSKHSLAECLDAMGDTQQANELRMQLLDSYDRHMLKRKRQEQQEQKKQQVQEQQGVAETIQKDQNDVGGK